MQLIKGLFIAAVLCVASVSAGNSEQHQKQWVDPYPPEAESDSKSGSTTPAPVEKGFNVHQVNFASSDPAEEGGEEKENSSNTWLVVGAVGACACVGVLAAVYMKRRNDDDKLPGEIFTIDDKNSVLNEDDVKQRYSRIDYMYPCQKWQMPELRDEDTALQIEHWQSGSCFEAAGRMPILSTATIQMKDHWDVALQALQLDEHHVEVYTNDVPQTNWHINLVDPFNVVESMSSSSPEFPSSRCSITAITQVLTLLMASMIAMKASGPLELLSARDSSRVEDSRPINICGNNA